MRRRASLREGSVAELFEATEGERRPRWWRSLGRGPPSGSPYVLAPRLVAAIVLVGVIAVTALFLSVWQLVREEGERTVGVAETRTVRVLGTTEVDERAPPAGPPPVRRIASVPARLVLTATRGDCWLEARVSSATGTVLFAGTLEQGRSIRLTRKRLWLAFGAGGNLEATLNGRSVESFPTGTATVLVTSEGVSRPLGT